VASALGIHATDAYVLDCALAERTPLLSIDRGQRAAAERGGLDLFPF